MVTKRSTERHVTATCPGWLLPNGDRYKVDKKRAATVYRAFKLVIEGLSPEAIADKFAQEERPLVRIGRRGKATDETTWTKTSVYFILKNRDVIGNKAKRYPGIVFEHDFEKVQIALKAHRGGRRDNRNLFAGILVCGECGTTLKLRDTYAACPRKHVSQSLAVVEALVGEAVWGNMMHFEMIPKINTNAARASNAAHIRRHLKQVRLAHSGLTITRVNGEVIEYQI